MFTIGLLLSLIPFTWAIVIKFLFKRRIHVLEMLGVFAAGVLVVAIGLTISYGSSVADTQILNGQVTNKDTQDSSCRHSYPCRCRSTKNGMKCDTCYMHSFDRHWYVYSTVGTSEIYTSDSQGLSKPARWEMARIGEPYARENGYTNYILGVGDSLFAEAHLSAEAKTQMPAYQEVYDYYRYHHAIALGAQVPDLAQWDQQIAMALEGLGSSKQVNINVIFVAGKPIEFAKQLEAAWSGGKKNDVNIVIGLSNYPKVEWVYPFTFAKSAGNALTVIQLRDRLREPGALDSPGKAVITIQSVISNSFHRKPMAEFEYLADEITPSVSAIVAIIILMIVACAGVTMYSVSNDLDSEGTIL